MTNFLKQEERLCQPFSILILIQISFVQQKSEIEREGCFFYDFYYRIFYQITFLQPKSKMEKRHCRSPFSGFSRRNILFFITDIYSAYLCTTYGLNYGGRLMFSHFHYLIFTQISPAHDMMGERKHHLTLKSVTLFSLLISTRLSLIQRKAKSKKTDCLPPLPLLIFIQCATKPITRRKMYFIISIIDTSLELIRTALEQNSKRKIMFWIFHYWYLPKLHF